jgi:hypothetical protein
VRLQRHEFSFVRTLFVIGRKLREDGAPKF